MLFRPYDRLEAVSYAHRWAYGRNPAFYDYEEIGGDCTNYASQCIYVGTGVMNYRRLDEAAQASGLGRSAYLRMVLYASWLREGAKKAK